MDLTTYNREARPLKYDFRFLTPERANREQDESHHWFPVSRVYDFTSGREVHRELQAAELGNHEFAYDILYELFRVVHEAPVIPFFEETEQNLDKVLNIFIRVNSGGTPLSYSDLLLSIATAQWKQLDARDVIHGLVDDLNRTRNGFQISKDLVLKAGLMLGDLPSVAFRVTNFNASNMQALERNWEEIARALRLSVELLADLGFSRQNLAADSVVIPIAYYVFRRKLDGGYLGRPSESGDRDDIRTWVCRSLVKAGIWGSALDSLLLALRSAIVEYGRDGFPLGAVESAMAKRGKSLTFTTDEIEDLLGCAYGEKRTFPLLSLLYPSLDVRNHFHLDHVFPRAAFHRRDLRAAGLGEDEIDEFQDLRDRLPNLQLLEGQSNQAKSARPPFEWLADRFPSPDERDAYCRRHDLGDIPPRIAGFRTFFDARRDRMKARLREVLRVEVPAEAPVAGI